MSGDPLAQQAYWPCPFHGEPERGCRVCDVLWASPAHQSAVNSLTPLARQAYDEIKAILDGVEQAERERKANQATIDRALLRAVQRKEAAEQENEALRAALAQSEASVATLRQVVEKLAAALNKERAPTRTTPTP